MKYVPVSLHSTLRKTRWSAQLNIVKPVVKHLATLQIAVEDAELLKPQPHVHTELQSIKEHVATFEYSLLSTIWI
jgi:hypothetical protein